MQNTELHAVVPEIGKPYYILRGFDPTHALWYAQFDSKDAAYEALELTQNLANSNKANIEALKKKVKHYQKLLIWLAMSVIPLCLLGWIKLLEILIH